MNKTKGTICDVFIVIAAVALLFGVITRIAANPIVFGVTSQAFLQLAQGFLLFAIAVGVRELMKK